MSDPLTDTITRGIERVPKFLKLELLSKNPIMRSGADETVATMIAAAL